MKNSMRSISLSREEFILGFQGSIAIATVFASFAQIKGKIR